MPTTLHAMMRTGMGGATRMALIDGTARGRAARRQRCGERAAGAAGGGYTLQIGDGGTRSIPWGRNNNAQLH